MDKTNILVYKNSPDNVIEKEMFYKYKTIEMYRLKTSEKEYLKYLFSILFVDKYNENKGDIIPCIDVRSLPGYEKLIRQKGELVLMFFPDKIVPKLFFEALNKGLIKKSMCVKWTRC